MITMNILGVISITVVIIFLELFILIIFKKLSNPFWILPIRIIPITITIIFVLFLIFYIEENDNLIIKTKFCEDLNGELYVYALDQPEFLCKINEEIYNLDNLKKVNITKLVGK